MSDFLADGVGKRRERQPANVRERVHVQRDGTEPTDWSNRHARRGRVSRVPSGALRTVRVPRRREPAKQLGAVRCAHTEASATRVQTSYRSATR